MRAAFSPLFRLLFLLGALLGSAPAASAQAGGEYAQALPVYESSEEVPGVFHRLQVVYPRRGYLPASGEEILRFSQQWAWEEGADALLLETDGSGGMRAVAIRLGPAPRKEAPAAAPREEPRPIARVRQAVGAGAEPVELCVLCGDVSTRREVLSLSELRNSERVRVLAQSEWREAPRPVAPPTRIAAVDAGAARVTVVQGTVSLNGGRPGAPQAPEFGGEGFGNGVAPPPSAVPSVPVTTSTEAVSQVGATTTDAATYLAETASSPAAEGILGSVTELMAGLGEGSALYQVGGLLGLLVVWMLVRKRQASQARNERTRELNERRLANLASQQQHQHPIAP